MSDQKNSLHIHSWHDFFAKLGVEDFISIKPRDVHLNKDNIVSFLVVRVGDGCQVRQPTYIGSKSLMQQHFEHFSFFYIKIFVIRAGIH